MIKQGSIVRCFSSNEIRTLEIIGYVFDLDKDSYTLYPNIIRLQVDGKPITVWFRLAGNISVDKKDDDIELVSVKEFDIYFDNINNKEVDNEYLTKLLSEYLVSLEEDSDDIDFI